VIVPLLPGGLSAYGILVSDIVKDHSRTVLWRVEKNLPTASLEKEFRALRQSAERQFHSEGWRGGIRHHPSVDVRYRGQGYELNVPYTKGLIRAFEREHKRRYGYAYESRDVELVTLRLRSTMKSPPVKFRALNPMSAGTSGRARVVFGGQATVARIYARDELVPGRQYSGPAVVTEYSATTAVPAGMRFQIDGSGNLVIEVRP
jgi:N-methylhydantoinase A